MRRDRIEELHFISPLRSVPSILDRGILSHQRARTVPHVSVADVEVQERRRGRRAPEGLLLHQYANLYFHARNAMLYRLLRTSDETLVVLAVDPGVLDVQEVIVTDRNAASGAALFYPAAVGILELDEEAVYARWWTEIDARQRRQAEVLVPHRVDPMYITKAYVADQDDRKRLERLTANRLPVVVHPDLFFRG